MKKNKRLSKEIENIEKNLSYESDLNELPPPDIVAYNELRSCADLLRLHKKKVLQIQPEFQREIVWKDPDKTRFVDSLTKQLPIPSMCFSLDYKTEKWQVIDGLQRMNSIINFLTKEDWKLSKISDVDRRLSGKTVYEIKTKYPTIYRRVENVSLPINIIRCDFNKSSHTEFLFTIFRRLNSGGMKLNNQEIRNCIYMGSYNNFLKRCNANSNWKKLMNIKQDRVYRFLKEELILRFFAFYEKLSEYNGKLAKFLNDYMEKNKNLSEEVLNKKEKLFKDAVNLIYYKISNQKSLDKVSNAFMDALMFGVFSNIKKLNKKRATILRRYYNKLKNDKNFSDKNLREGIMKKDKVRKRLLVARKIFSGR